MTVREISSRLVRAGIDPDSAVFEARLLAEHFCNIPISRLIAEPERELDHPELEDAVRRRESRYPLQYILGSWEFMGLPIRVTEDTLIPRPDTEVIAERAILDCPAGGRVLDLCAGSGCILAAILSYTKGTEGVAVELFPKTAAVAELNFRLLGLSERCRLIVGDATTDLFSGESFDVIVSNPPYVTSDEMLELEPELMFEPERALTDGGNGVYIIRKIIEIHKSRLKPNGVMLIEHGWRQAELVREIARENGLRYELIRDYGGNPRGARLTCAD